MRITATAWAAYTQQLAKLNKKAGQLMADYIAAHGTGDTDALIAYAHALVTKYGEGSAELACQMYDALAAAAKAGVPAAEPAQPASYGEIARMVQATKASPPQMQRGVSRLVKRAGADTTLKNALRDGAEFAWVPQGDTCAFCLTLASRGWQKASQAAIKGGHAEHIHANCDCEYAIRFDGRSTVAGYDPDKYLRQYRAAGSDVNALRRVNYAKNRERINAQKKGSVCSAAEEPRAESCHYRHCHTKSAVGGPEWGRSPDGIFYTGNPQGAAAVCPEAERQQRGCLPAGPDDRRKAGLCKGRPDLGRH